MLAHNRIHISLSIFRQLRSVLLLPSCFLSYSFPLLLQVTYTSLLKGYCQHGQMILSAWQLLQEMVNAGIMPNRRTYNTVLRGCLRSPGSLDIAKQMYEAAHGEMEEGREGDGMCSTFSFFFTSRLLFHSLFRFFLFSCSIAVFLGLSSYRCCVLPLCRIDTSLSSCVPFGSVSFLLSFHRLRAAQVKRDDLEAKIREDEDELRTIPASAPPSTTSQPLRSQLQQRHACHQHSQQEQHQQQQQAQQQLIHKLKQRITQRKQWLDRFFLCVPMHHPLSIWCSVIAKNCKWRKHGGLQMK